MATRPRVSDRSRLRVAMIGTRGLAEVDGGVERAVTALSHELVALGHDVTVYGRRPYCARSNTRVGGVKQVPLPCIKTKHLEALSHTTFSTLHGLASRSYDVIHFHAAGPSLLAFLPRLARRPTVATVHALDHERAKWGPVATRVLQAGVWSATRIPNQTIAVSRELSAHLSVMSGRAVHYIPNGVDLPSQSSLTPVDELSGQRFALFLGRLVPEKGIDTLIQAFMGVRVDATLAIAGSASHSDDYVRYLHAMADGDARIRFLGSRTGGQKLWLLQNAAVVVQPSTVEGQAIALLEAAACGAPVIVSDIPANLEVIAGSPTATVFPTGDPIALGNALDTLFASPAPPRQVQPSPQIGLHDWRRIAEQTVVVYRKAAADHAISGLPTDVGMTLSPER